MQPTVFIGCDIAQDSFDFCVRTQHKVLEQGQTNNTAKAIRAWIKQLRKQYDLEQAVLGVEHTGIYTAILLREWYAEDLTVCLEHAMQIKLSLGMQRGKNDKVDAERIAEYLIRYTDRLKVWRPKRQVIEQLQLLQRCRQRLIKARKMLTQMVKDSKRFLQKERFLLEFKASKRSVAALDADLQQIEKQIKAIIQSDDHLKTLRKYVTSVVGVGDVTFVEMIVRTNEFKDFDNAKQIACTAGVAPFPHQSGSSLKGRPRVSHRAHKRLKTLLHLCAMAAVKSPGEIQDYYQKKLDQGKTKMCVLNAVRNKLVHRIFVVATKQVMYDRNYQYRLAKP